MGEVKFKCTNSKCQVACDCVMEQDENRLQLKIEIKHYQTFDISEDGSLEDVDGDSEQEIFLQCPICGDKYEFEVDENEFVLQLEERHVMTRFNLGKVRYGISDVVNIRDLGFKKKE